jgi:Uma2 family endonuclease
MSVATKLVTADELMAMGGDAPYELIQGVLYEVTPTKFVHMVVAGNFVNHLVLYSNATLPGRVLVGEGGFRLESNPDSVIAPDVAFMRAERVPPKSNRDDWGRVPPDAVVEVLSPSNTKAEVDRKVGVYRRAGVPLIWVANTRRETITAYTRDGRVRVYRVGEDLDGGEVLPGFRVPVAAFFE